jgi:hypothetical protein
VPRQQDKGEDQRRHFFLLGAGRGYRSVAPLDLFSFQCFVLFSGFSVEVGRKKRMYVRGPGVWGEGKGRAGGGGVTSVTDRSLFSFQKQLYSLHFALQAFLPSYSPKAIFCC